MDRPAKFMKLMHNHCDVSKLPDEVLGNIFVRLSLTDLLTTCSCVCKSWSKVILNPLFLPWKKLYVSVKIKRMNLLSAVVLNPSKRDDLMLVTDLMDNLFKMHGLEELNSFLIKSICFLGNVHCSPDSLEESCKRLEHHRLFKPAYDCLLWIPDTLIPKPHNVWHFVATIIILSEDVWDVQRLLHLLLSPSFNSTATDVTEAFYSLATIFLHASRSIDFPIRYHYYVYYALYLFENSWQPMGNTRSSALSTMSGQQAITSFVTVTRKKRLTHEQARIVNHPIKSWHVVKIIAFAGTGKTTTLLEFCKERPQLRILLIVYNKSVAVHCSQVFPNNNTTVRTAHALAYRSVGRRYQSVKKLDGNLSPMKISSVLKQKKDAGNRFKRAGLVKLTLEKFVNSADPFLTLRHVPEKDKNGIELDGDFRLHIILDDAQMIWKEMTKCTKFQKVSMTQDGQLKQWQLQKPKIPGFDVILIDEGQDMSPPMLDVFLNQDAAKVIVGDPFQQIYSFRGATNALQSVPATHIFYLTQSFRFGPEIGFLAHCLLEKLLNVSKETLVGGFAKDTILANPHEGGGQMQRAYLCRSNLQLYKLSLQICRSQRFRGKVFAFAGTLDKFGLEDVVDIWKLSQVSRGVGTPEIMEMKSEFIALFESVRALENYAENAEDIEMLNKIQMFRYSGHNTVNDVNLLRSVCSFDMKVADVVFSTIHKAKGLEWDWVILADDLLLDGVRVALHSEETQMKEELNLLYVASTRAKKRLTINTAAIQALNLGREKLERLTVSSEINEKTRCLQCRMSISASSSWNERHPPLITKVSTLPLSCDGVVLHGGFICYTCASFSLFELTYSPRRMLNERAHEKVRDLERVVRLPLLIGEILETFPEAGLVPIRWDRYRK